LTASKAFASVSLLGLISHPAQMLLLTIPGLYGGWASGTRIQDFLTTGFREVAEYKDDENDQDGSPAASVNTVASASKVVLKYFTKKGVTKPITFDIKRGSITAILGPVGSGKSILLRTVLGEVLPQTGIVMVTAPSIGYCAANAWIQKSTVRKNIVGPLGFDESWYNRVIDICDLNKDLARMKDGDSSEVGSGGSMLSGGQKQ
jgi:ATP-binding cassette, subfamily C (CFTR/MRP), member 1